MASRKPKVEVEETVVEAIVDNVVVDSEVEVTEKVTKKVAKASPAVTPAILVDNRFVDRIMGDMDYRVKNMYESLQLVADKDYVQEKRIMFLVHLLTESLKVGGTLRIPKELNLDINDATIEGDFLVVTKK